MTIYSWVVLSIAVICIAGALVEKLYVKAWRKKIKGGLECYFVNDHGKKIRGKVGYYHSGLSQYSLLPHNSEYSEVFKSADELFPTLH